MPPPPEELMETLGQWEKFIHQRDAFPELIQCALIHEQFEAIHPFLDGNGRVGRLLITLFLMERGRLSHPLLYLSAFIESRRQEYYQRLQAVRTDGDWAGWLQYFLRGVIETSNEGVKRSRTLLDIRAKYRAKLKGKARAMAFLDELFANPYTTVAKAQKFLGTSNPTARTIVRQLEEVGLLQEATGRRWGRVFLAQPILRIIEATGI